MNFDLLLDNLTNPALLFFVLGVIAIQVKSDLNIHEQVSKFISLYLMFSIGFKGGQELSHSKFDWSIVYGMGLGLFSAIMIPIYSFFILKRKLNVYDAGAIAAAYGSVSAVTFVTAASFLEIQGVSFSGHMVAVMAMMEVPSIVVGVMLIQLFASRDEKNSPNIPVRKIVHHSITNGSVLLIIGSLLIGFLASEKQAMGIKPFTTDIFKGFLAIFLLDMGLICGRKIKDFLKFGRFTVIFAVVVPLLNGIIFSYLSTFVTDNLGDRFMLAILAASASYIAVPAAMRMAVPKSNPGIYIPMALAITFPLNITLGFPIYYYCINNF